MKRLLLLAHLAILASIPVPAFAQAAGCTNLTITGHPTYPPIGYKHGERIVGAGATLVERIAADLEIPVRSQSMGSWADAQSAARDGKADVIFGIYLNDERATYLTYVQPAFMKDPVVVMVPKGKAFPFRDRRDLVGKKGVTNAGESYGSDFDSFMDKSLTVARSNGVEQAFADLLAGRADYMIVGLYPGLSEAAKIGVKDRIEPLATQLLTADMFIAFSKKSPCLGQVPAFGRKVEALRTSGAVDELIRDATKTWDAAQK